MKEQLQKAGIVPVIKLSETEKAIDLAKALRAGGINWAEVTFRAKGAEKVIEAMATSYPDMFVGAGTVLTMEEAEKAVSAGAKFIVSPGFDNEIVDFALAKKVLPLPGCVTPTEIQMAIKKGLSIVKFFPAAQFGGIKTIKALAGPFGTLQFMPTGGISLENLEEYLQVKNVIACGGSFMVKEELITENKWDAITEMSKCAMEIVTRVSK
ncbi:2-dehydro-3-deoxyphosphogluconate aldolase/(4S)-4-hydroxy-2-oxoglutarate aldolase [Clostridiales Family XIII bacterium PM5-7]